MKTKNSRYKQQSTIFTSIYERSTITSMTHISARVIDRGVVYI